MYHINTTDRNCMQGVVCYFLVSIQQTLLLLTLSISCTLAYQKGQQLKNDPRRHRLRYTDTVPAIS